MKRILLVSNKVMHYRIEIYNAFFDMFKENEYEFHVASNEWDNQNQEYKFFKHDIQLNIGSVASVMKSLKPDYVINFLHLKDRLLFTLTGLCKLYGIPCIYWNHGVNLKDPDNKLKNLFFKAVHTISDRIILYTPDQLKYISKKNQQKVYIAYNTLNLESDRFAFNVPEIKDKLGLSSGKSVVLYISRILPYKGLDILLDILSDSENVELVIVGSPISDIQLKKVEQTSHYHYLGELYGEAVDEIYAIGDVFSTPGHIGLALNQAFYWGVPVAVLNRVHAPEIHYLKEGFNGFICDNVEELKSKIENIKSLAATKKEISKFYDDNLSINEMFKGFYDCVKSCEK